MIVAMADTHAVLWCLYSDARLGSAASSFFDATIANGDHIGVSAISLVEIVYLVEKRRIPANALNELLAEIADPNAVLKHVPLDEKVAIKMAEVPRQNISDLPDRVIAATALLRGVPLLSRDAQIRSLRLETIW